MNRVLNKGSSGKTEEKKSRDRESSADKRTKDEVHHVLHVLKTSHDEISDLNIVI